MAVWQQEQAARCSGCGRWEWEHEENPEAWWADNYRCPWCEQTDRLKAVLSDEPDLFGMKVGLFRTPREDPDGD